MELGEVRGFPVKDVQGGLGVRKDRRQRLVDFVGQGSGELSGCSHPGYLGKLLPEDVLLFLGLLAPGDVLHDA